MSQSATTEPLSQSEVLAAEIELIRRRRREAGLSDELYEQQPEPREGQAAAPLTAPDSASSPDGRPPLADLNPVGLALSGGGARSAAFALGVIQAFHRFGLMRYVDYLSAVSGGTYAAGMFVQSLEKNRKYTADNCDLASDNTGQSSPFVQRVSTRGNYLFRIDLFLARFIPTFILNLAPQLCMLVAIGSGIAFLWRLLDHESVRDHLGAFGFNDLGAAFLPTIAAGTLWGICYVASLAAASRPLQRVSTWLLAVTLGSALIGMAVVIGNGDVTFGTTPTTTTDEDRIKWLSELWVPLTSLVGLGLIPLLMPKKLIRSGTQPRGWFDSWIFYYVSLALFIGVPLVFVGLFAKENISGYNETRGPALLAGDIKDWRSFEQLVRTGQSHTTYQFADIPLYVRLNLQPFAQTPAAQTLPQMIRHLNREHNAAVSLLRFNQYPPPVRFPDPAASSSITPDAANVPDPDVAWHQTLKLQGIVTALGERFASWTGSSQSPYSDYIHNRREALKIQQAATASLSAVMQQELLFSFHRRSTARSADIKIEKISNDLRDQLLAIAAGPIPAKQPLANSVPAVTEYGVLNRNLLEAAFPNMIRPRTELRRMNLIVMDQGHRLAWFVGSLLAAVVLGRCINPNQLGLHGYYRDRLAATFLNRGGSQTCQAFPEIPSATLSQVTPHEQGAAYPLFQTSVLTREAWEHADQLERPFRPFVLAPAHCGNEQLQFIATEALGDREPTLADTVAISGGAVHPAYFVHHILAFLVNTMNWRMGQLFPNPQLNRWHRPSMLHQAWTNLRQTLNPSAALAPENVLLTDGGHSENLGIEPLLTRRCRLIIVCDAGHDPGHVLDDLAKVVRRLESTQGIRLADVIPRRCDSHPADGQPLRIPGNMAGPILSHNGDGEARSHRESVDRLFKRLAEQAEKRHCFVASIHYPECGTADSRGRCQHPQFEGRLIYIKPCLTGDEGLQLYNYAFRHAEFPHESTLDQAFDEAQFEAYRRLGFHSGVDVCRDLPDPYTLDAKNAEATLWSAPQPWNLRKLCDRLLGPDGFAPDTVHADKEARTSRIRKEIGLLVKRFKRTPSNQHILLELESYGSDLSLAADRLAELPLDAAAPGDAHYHLLEHLDERAVTPLVDLILSSAGRAKPRKSVELAINWLAELIQDDRDIKLDKCIDSLIEFTQIAKNDQSRAQVVALLKSAAAIEAAPRIMAALRKVKRARRGDGLAANDGVVDADADSKNSDAFPTALAKTSAEV